MKYLAYTLYVATVLLISGFARANAATLSSIQTQTQYETLVNVSQVALDQSAQQLLIAGSLPNPCYQDPSALLTQDPHNPGVLVLRMTSQVPMQMCVSRVKYFDTEVALATLVQASRVNLDSKAIYLLKVDGTNFEMRISGSDLLN